VDGGLQVQVCRVAQLIGCDDPGSEAAAAVEVLAGRRSRVVALPVPDRGVIEAGVAGHVPQGVLARDVAPGGADDNGQLALVVQVAGDARAKDGLPVTDDAAGHAQEDAGVGGAAYLAGLLRVVLVVNADAENSPRVWDWRQQLEVRQRYVGCGAGDEGSYFVQAAGRRKHAEQRREGTAQARAEVVDAIAVAEGSPALVVALLVGEERHPSLLA